MVAVEALARVEPADRSGHAQQIETVEEADALRALGCRQGQGFLFSRPVRAEEVGAILSGPALFPATEPRPDEAIGV